MQADSLCARSSAKESDVSLADFFTNWAKIWRTKAKEQYQQLLLSIDVHGPAKLRANIQVQNIDEFYTTFDIKPGDPMYRAPEDRVQICKQKRKQIFLLALFFANCLFLQSFFHHTDHRIELRMLIDDLIGFCRLGRSLESRRFGFHSGCLI